MSEPVISRLRGGRTNPYVTAVVRSVEKVCKILRVARITHIQIKLSSQNVVTYRQVFTFVVLYRAASKHVEKVGFFNSLTEQEEWLAKSEIKNMQIPWIHIYSIVIVQWLIA